MLVDIFKYRGGGGKLIIFKSLRKVGEVANGKFPVGFVFFEIPMVAFVKYNLFIWSSFSSQRAMEK